MLNQGYGRKLVELGLSPVPLEIAVMNLAETSTAGMMNCIGGTDKYRQEYEESMRMGLK